MTASVQCKILGTAILYKEKIEVLNQTCGFLSYSVTYTEGLVSNFTKKGVTMHILHTLLFYSKQIILQFTYQVTTR